MSEEEILDKLRKMLYHTQKANECGLSNNDFKEDIEALELLHDRYLKEKEERQYEKELRLKYERRYNSKIEENKKLKEKNKELEEQLRKANEYIRNEMYIDDNPTICGDEENTITELPISLYLYNEGLRELLELLEERN